MRKRFGGRIENWQFHRIELDKASVKELKKLYPDIPVPVRVFTGTIASEMHPKYPKGFHMRSSLVIKRNKKRKLVETLNTVYRLVGKEGGDVFPDLGKGVFNIFY